MTRLAEFKHEISYLKSRVELAQSSAVVSSNERTTFVFAPNATGNQPPNVFTVWTSLLTAVALTRGPIWIQFDPAPLSAALTVPGGNLSGHNDVTFIGAAPPAAGFPTAINVTAPFTNGYPNEIINLQIIYSGAAAPCLNFTNSATQGTPHLTFRGASLLSTTGGQPFLQADGTTNAVFANILLFDDVAVSGAATVFKTLGANPALSVRMYDNSLVGTNTIASAVAATATVNIFSTGASYDPAQAAATVTTLPAGVLQASYTYSSDAGRNFARFTPLDAGSSGILQVTPGALTDTFAAIVIPRVSGRFMVNATCMFSVTGAATATISLVSRTKAAAIVVANGTAIGSTNPSTNQGCFRNTASGAITYGGGMTSLTHHSSLFVDTVGSVPFEYSFSGIITPVPTANFTLYQNLAIAITVQTSANNLGQQTGGGGGPTASLSVQELA